MRVAAVPLLSVLLTCLQFVQAADPNGSRKTMREPVETATSKPFLGIGVDKSDDGIIVTTVVSGFPGDAAGIQPGDLILSIDQGVVRTIDDLVRTLTAKRPGDQVIVEVLRNDQRLRRTLTAVASPVTGYNVLLEFIDVAFKEHDAAKLSASFSPDGDLVAPNGEYVTGGMALRRFFATHLHSDKMSLDPKFTRVRVVTDRVLILDGTWMDRRTKASGFFTAVVSASSESWSIISLRLSIVDRPLAQ